MIHLDTHAVVWLYLAELHRFSDRGRRLLDQEDLAISPMVTLELQYLREIGRLNPAPSEVLDDLSSTVGLSVCSAPFEQVVRRALGETWTRDPFDRVIASQAGVASVRLLTRDPVILGNFPGAVWD